MRVYFSSDYKGGNVYLGMKYRTQMMDLLVADEGGLISFLELRLGLHSVAVPESERLVEYYKCVREYMSEHSDEAKRLYDSFTVSPLVTSREMLKWRDALTACGWSADSPAPTNRMRVLQGVERIFASKDLPEQSKRLKAIGERLKQKKGCMAGVTLVMPFDANLLHPAWREIISLAAADGAQIERLAIPAIDGDSNLAKLKRLLTSETNDRIMLNPDDDSVRIWDFKDDMESEEYLAMMKDDEFDVCIKPDNKLIDNYLHMMGKPVAGSSVANSAPQIIQMFFTGVAMLARPLNIGTLLQWLYAPSHPLPGAFRYQLAERLARTGGWLPESQDGDINDCYHLVKDWIEGSKERENGNPIDAREQKERQHKASVLLPDFEGGYESTISVARLRNLLTELGVWSRQRCAIIAQTQQDNTIVAQYEKLSDLCNTLLNLIGDLKTTEKVEYCEIEKHLACLYEPSEFVQYGAQATSRYTISTPGQMAANAKSVLWGGLYNFDAMLPPTDFLTPTEHEALASSLKLWDANDARRLQQSVMLLPLLFCQEQLTLITLQGVGGKTVNKHPLMVRLEQQVKNLRDITSSPRISDDCYEEVPLMVSNAQSGSDSCYTSITQADLIKWREHESPTTIDKLIQNPIDYTLENIAYISDNGKSDLSNLDMTKGNVAHAVIQHLFLTPGDAESGTASAIKQRVDAHYDDVFAKMIEAKGAILLLQENEIERRQLSAQLKTCIGHLIEIIEKNNLRVKACEMQLDGNTFGEPDENTPTMHGFADMVLTRSNGQHVIFDFKWTRSKEYYQDLLRKNSSSQLAIYADLLGRLTNANTLPTAYFLMPRGRLYSTEKFESNWAEQIEIDADCRGDIIGKLLASYRYRREEIMSGKIELGEGVPLTALNYFNDTGERNLFPLKSQYGNPENKADNTFSNYTNLKN